MLTFENVRKRLILHIGDAKTGSTAIQLALCQHEKMLSEQKPFLYPEPGRRQLNCHHNLAWQLNSSPSFSEIYGTWCELIQDIENRTEHTFLLSSESFEDVDPNSLLSFLESRTSLRKKDILVAMYIRPHFSRIRSMYTQTVKMGRFTGDLDSFVNRYLCANKNYYYKRAQTWRSTFGQENFVLRPFIRENLIDHDVLSDFSHAVLGLGADFLENYSSDRRVNEAPTSEILEIIKGYSSRLGTPGCELRSQKYNQLLFSKLRDGLGDLYANSSKGVLFNDNSARAIYNHYSQDANQLDRVFFGRPLFSNALSQDFKKSQLMHRCNTGQIENQRERTIHRRYQEIIIQILENVENY